MWLMLVIIVSNMSKEPLYCSHCTCIFQTQMTLNEATAESIVQNVTDLLRQSGSEDESTTNLEMLSDLFGHLEEIATLNSQTTQNLVQILDQVQGWPVDVRQKDAARSDIPCCVCMPIPYSG